ncbi:hypothetical protein ACFFIX_09525 [Metabacillus herbersteinensis]|uniref:Uncharacterized protein n=1 Tax=Metabacillus herbersteinensis TaxID=283816 RepID=A0ABV6GDE0_9BACI
MFDPTTFDNLKVILEGYVYDLDLDNVIVVTDRSDLVNLATMSRSFSISFKLPIENPTPTVKIQLEMIHEQLSGELLGKLEHPGCRVKIKIYEVKESSSIDEILVERLKRIWGKSYDLKLYVTQQIPENRFHHQYSLETLMLVLEVDGEILLNMVEYAMDSIKLLSQE